MVNNQLQDINLAPESLAISVLCLISTCKDVDLAYNSSLWFLNSTLKGAFDNPTAELVDKLFQVMLYWQGLPNHLQPCESTLYFVKHGFKIFDLMKKYFFKGFEFRQKCILLFYPFCYFASDDEKKIYFDTFGSHLIEYLEESSKEDFSRSNACQLNDLTEIFFTIVLSLEVKVFDQRYSTQNNELASHYLSSIYLISTFLLITRNFISLCSTR